jgi:Zn-dependent metalloprotease
MAMRYDGHEAPSERVEARRRCPEHRPARRVARVMRLGAGILAALGVLLSVVTAAARERMPGGAAAGPVAAREPEPAAVSTARAYLKQRHPELFGGRGGELAVDRVDVLGGSSHVRFHQEYRGVPVWGAAVSVHMDALGRVRLAYVDVRPDLELATTAPALSPAEAAARAEATLAGEVARRDPEDAEAGASASPPPALGIENRAGQPRLAYRVLLATGEPADWEVSVDAQTGAVIRRVDLLRRADGAGLVADENLLTTPVPGMRDLVDLAGNGLLQGAGVSIFSFAGFKGSAMQRQRLSRAPDGQFTAAPDDPRFDEQMLYYHASRARAYFRGTFGAGPRGGALPATAHLMQAAGKGTRPLDGAYYSPAENALFFGDGAGRAAGGLNSTSRDADVICHEFSHSVMFRIVDMARQPDDFGRALEEGYADYFAGTMNNDPEIGEYAAGSPAGLRSLANSHRYPEDVNYPLTGAPEAHWTGMIWGGTCWDVRAALGPAVADALVFRSLYYQPDHRADFATAARALLEADHALYQESHVATLRGILAARGLPMPQPAPAAGS